MGGTVTIIVPIVPQTHAYGYLSLCAPAQAPYETCGPGHQEPHLSWTRHPPWLERPSTPRWTWHVERHASYAETDACAMAVEERGMPRDPYWDYEHDIKQALSHAEKLSREAPFDASVRTPLGNTLDELRQDLSDVKETVRIVEQSDANRFGIDARELDRRKEFISKSEQALQRLSRASVASDTPASTSLAWEREQQQMLLANQDQALDTIGSSLSTLRSQAQLIGQETDEHVLMLGELDADVDRAQTRLQRAMTQMDRFVARADARVGGWCVWILVVVRGCKSNLSGIAAIAIAGTHHVNIR